MIRYLHTDAAEPGTRATVVTADGERYELLVLDVGRCDGVVGMIDVEVFVNHGRALRGQVDVYVDQADERDAALLTVPEYGETWQRDLRTFIVDGAR